MLDIFSCVDGQLALFIQDMVPYPILLEYLQCFPIFSKYQGPFVA